ncbi:hypothetical protein [Phenylobacterium sp.]|jgi:hypothetical protein|uniref:hypothetical protein n=1 Tax=Phenylobacterium sp. TaxID=1871053 RepID=UPI002F3FC5BC
MIAAGALALMLMAPSQLGDFRHGADPDLRKLAGLPKDVRVHIDRAINCGHWAGEEPYDAARRREIERALRSLHCEVFDAEAKRLRRKYAASPDMLALMKQYEEEPE